MSDNGESDRAADEVVPTAACSGYEGGDSKKAAIRNRKVMFRFDADTDELLCKEVLALNPYHADFGAVGPTWDRIADALGLDVDGRRCRERVKLLVKNRKRDVAALEKASGIEETVSNLDAMLDEIVLVQDSQKEIQVERKKERAEGEDKAERAAEDIRQKAMEGMLPKVKRKASSDESALLAFLESRQAADVDVKRQKLVLEERRLALEERRLELAEQKAALENQERIAMISVLAQLTSKGADPKV